MPVIEPNLVSNLTHVDRCTIIILRWDKLLIYTSGFSWQNMDWATLFLSFCFPLVLVQTFAHVNKCWFSRDSCAASTSYVIRRKGSLSWTRVQEIADVTQNCLYRFKYGYFSYKNASIHYRRPLFTSRSCVLLFLKWMDALYLTTFGLLNKNTCPCHSKA